MSRTLIAVALGAMLGGFGCGNDPDDPMFVMGRAHDGDEEMLPGAPVKLFRARLEREEFGQEPIGCDARMFRESALLTTSGPPGFGPPRFEWQQLGETKANQDGRFLFELRSYQLWPPAGSPQFSYVASGGGSAPSCMRVDLEGGPNGARTSAWIWMGDTDVDLERMYRWDEGVVSIQRFESADLLSVPAGPLPATESLDNQDFGLFNQSDIVVYEWELTAPGQPLWREEKMEAPFVVDANLLEDFGDVHAHLNMLAFLPPPLLDVLPGAQFGYFERSTGPSVLVSADVPRVPVSRGAPCTAGGARLDPCAATDGKLELVVFDAQTTGLVLELRTSARPSLAIVRDLQTRGFPSLTIDGSADGITFSPLGSAAPPPIDQRTIYQQMTDASRTGTGTDSLYLRIDLAPPPQPITHVRLGSRDVLAVREISVFE